MDPDAAVCHVGRQVGNLIDKDLCLWDLPHVFLSPMCRFKRTSDMWWSDQSGLSHEHDHADGLGMSMFSNEHSADSICCQCFTCCSQLIDIVLYLNKHFFSTERWWVDMNPVIQSLVDMQFIPHTEHFSALTHCAHMASTNHACCAETACYQFHKSRSPVRKGVCTKQQSLQF